MEYYNKLVEVAAKKRALLNKASVYLSPCLSYLNPELKIEILSFSSLVNVRIYNQAVIDINTNQLSVVVNVKDFGLFNKHVSNIRKLDCYVCDHAFYKAFESNNLHTFVFELDYPGAIENFLKSKYSKMYSDEDAYKIFEIQKSDNSNVVKTKKQILSVCTKDEVYREKFEYFINTSLSKVQEQNTWINITEEDELDSAIELEKELYYEQA